MLAKAGARHITAIESNAKAFLKCLLVQNAFKFEAGFLYGDFRKYLAKTESRFDVVVASGVLYHMTDPVALLEDIATASDSVLLWTHYYDPDPAANNERTRLHMTETPKITEFRGRTVHLHRHDYLHFLQHDKFSGGSSPHSFWMTRDGLIGVLEALGMSVVIGADDVSHPHGPAITLFATRTPLQTKFDEEGYLAKYPDVATAVANGQIKSGAEHYFLFGRAEGRIASTGA